MNDASKYVLARLKERGYRMTKPRVETVVVLASAKGGLSLPELAQKVAGDEASVYRTVRTLEKEGLIEHIHDGNGQTFYAIAEHHHHHAVCTNCKKIVHLPCQHEHEVKRIEGFSTVTDHEVTYFGLCTKCG